jgi:hypothetical protein
MQANVVTWSPARSCFAHTLIGSELDRWRWITLDRGVFRFPPLKLEFQFFANNGHFCWGFDPQPDATSGDSDDGNRDIVSNPYALANFATKH